MKSSAIRFGAAAITLVLTALSLTASASIAAPPNVDNWVGTWIQNVQKSQYGDEKPPVDPAMIRQILKIRISNGALDLYIRTELADGTDVADETHLLDLTGKPHVTELDGFKTVTETFKQPDQNTIEITLRARAAESLEADGELAVKVILKMSADRNTIRETKEYHFKELASADKAANDDPNPAQGSVLVFDRQPSSPSASPQ